MLDEEDEVVVDISEWVERAKADPAAYIERQATEVFLTALGMTEPYGHKVFLKGGILMGVLYQSFRQTADIDFTSTLDPDPDMADLMSVAFAENLPRAAAELGYPDLMCRVQSVRRRPREDSFAKAAFPALEIRVAYARRDSPQQNRFDRGNATDVLHVDISFNEPVGAIQVVRFAGGGGAIRAYSLHDLIAEKLRALLQQEVRNRYRRQDIYDLDLLIGRFSFDKGEKLRLNRVLIEKCVARSIDPARSSLSKPEIARRARKEWETLGVEIGEVPDFDKCFTRVNKFYQSLPWSD
jgi:predicted nucleotidyltransferase component of viral defense system